MEKQNKNANKLTEKAFSRLMLTSVLGILVCITCLCSATWAWFSADITSDSNTLSSGNFGLNVSITDENSDLVSESDDSPFVCNLSKGKYTVTLKMTDDTTVTKGFCIISVGDDSYYTASINAQTDSFTFMLDVEEAGATVTFSPAWGFPSAEDLVEKNETLTIGSRGAPQG